LNYAIALYHSGEKRQAFEILDDLQRHPFLNQYYLLNVTIGKFSHLEGDDVKARQYLQKALQQTNAAIEKAFIKKMIDETSTG
jgi:RNA polymerase sigma-70 factor (ECF subfamily)